ncbi:hypothetical protein ACFTWS_14080 [Streptomyces sp. NPDC057027]|uniref:hypothetical protein n=1 Tax=Streptomyces sp. NPDC057027 TaxID=3346004 RepID=UPI00364266EA
MTRRELPYLTDHGKLDPSQEERELVEPLHGRVRVDECSHRRLLDGEWAPAVFFVRSPARVGGRGVLVACTPEACDRWVRAVVDYTTAVREATAELSAAHRRAATVPWWRHRAARRAFDAWETTRQRYEETMRQADEAYEPVGREIRRAIRVAEEESAARAREQARLVEEARLRRARLAERAVWGWSVVTDEGRSAVHVFRHDVPRSEAPAPTTPQASPCVDLAGLRRALKELDLPDVLWDGPALAETERELEGVGFGRWWRDQFHEDHRTFTAPPPPRGSSYRGNPSGGTATGGTGGFSGGHSGGFSCGGGF